MSTDLVFAAEEADMLERQMSDDCEFAAEEADVLERQMTNDLAVAAMDEQHATPAARIQTRDAYGGRQLPRSFRIRH